MSKTNPVKIIIGVDTHKDIHVLSQSMDRRHLGRSNPVT